MKQLRLAIITFMVLGLCSCQIHNEPDPYEPYNRAMFKINDKADQYVFTPLAKTYRTVTPKPARTAIHNFFDNLRDVKSFGSNLLRGNIKNAGYDFMRVATNTTFGLGGLINIADEANMPNNKNTLGDTFASWGWKNSNYLVLPLFGPSTVRDGLGNAISSVYNVDGLIFTEHSVRYSLTALNAIDQRENYLEATDTLNQMALDKYAVTRDAYMALRNKQLGIQPIQNDQIELVDPEANDSDVSTTHSVTTTIPTKHEHNNKLHPHYNLTDVPIFIQPIIK